MAMRKCPGGEPVPLKRQDTAANVLYCIQKEKRKENKKMYNYNADEFDREILKSRKASRSTRKIETVQAWRFNDCGSSSISYCSMTSIYEAYTEYKENYNF